MIGTEGRVLVVGQGRSRGALAAVRALGSAGWSVGVGSPAGADMVARSRWCRAHHRIPRPRGDASDFVDAVSRAVRDGHYDVVFGAGDDWVAALATYRGDIPAVVAHPPRATVAAVLDKIELARRAAEAGIPAPRGVVADARSLADWDGPVVVKARSHWFDGQSHLHRIEATRHEDPAGAAAAVARLDDAGFEAVLQEPVSGPLSALVGLFHDGRLVGRVQQRARGTWPSPAGVSSSAETVPVDEDLVARVNVLLKDLAWSGMAELQFLTPADGRPRLIDLNARFYGSMALANAAGPNLPDAWARQALGMPVGTLPDGVSGQRYTWLAGDLRRALTERRGGRLRDVVSSVAWAGRATESVISVRDPGPTLSLVADRVRAR